MPYENPGPLKIKGAHGLYSEPVWKITKQPTKHTNKN